MAINFTIKHVSVSLIYVTTDHISEHSNFQLFIKLSINHWSFIKSLFVVYMRNFSWLMICQMKNNGEMTVTYFKLTSPPANN